MTHSTLQQGRARRRGWLSVLLLPVVAVALACETGAGPKGGHAQSTDVDARIGYQAKPLAAPPPVTASMTRSRPNWKDGQQLFTLTLTNNGMKTETVHAIVHATNEEIQPPRRAISPPTAYGWFELVGSRDGKLTARDIERSWKKNPFVSARGGKMPASWIVTVEPGQSTEVEASHVLDDTSPHPAVKGKRLAKEGFLDYRIWLFTSDGQLFDETIAPPRAPVAERPTTGKMPADTKKAPETKAEDPETLAKQQFKLALADLEKNDSVRAREKLRLILEKYSMTATAKAARKLLKELDN